MRPDVTFLTSSELQAALGNDLDGEDEDALRRFRDRVLDRFDAHLDAVAAMEETWGAEWQSFDQRIWLFDGEQADVSSPILLRADDEDRVVFAAVRMLAKQLVRETPVESELLEQGYAREDAVATVLAVEALGRGEPDAADLLADARETGELKTWRAADDIRERWGGDGPLRDWVERNG